MEFLLKKLRQEVQFKRFVNLSFMMKPVWVFRKSDLPTPVLSYYDSFKAKVVIFIYLIWSWPQIHFGISLSTAILRQFCSEWNRCCWFKKKLSKLKKYCQNVHQVMSSNLWANSLTTNQWFVWCFKIKRSLSEWVSNRFGYWAVFRLCLA